MSYVYAAQGGGLYLAMLSALHGSLRGMPDDDSIGGPAAGAVLTKVATPAPTSIGEVLPNIQQNVAHQSCIKINGKETSFFCTQVKNVGAYPFTTARASIPADILHLCRLSVKRSLQSSMGMLVVLWCY